MKPVYRTGPKAKPLQAGSLNKRSHRRKSIRHRELVGVVRWQTSDTQARWVPYVW